MTHKTPDRVPSATSGIPRQAVLAVTRSVVMAGTLVVLMKAMVQFI